MSVFSTLTGLMRVPFLILTPACVFLGYSIAAWTIGKVNPLHFLMVLFGGISSHISVNVFNEYFDYKSGLDFRTRRTPFSGGSGTLPTQPERANLALITGIVTLTIAVLIGIYFFRIVGLQLLPIGVAGLLIVFTYTKWLSRSPFLCLIAPGLGFGTLMVIGTDLVLSGNYSWTAFIASCVPFFTVSNLLLLNQFPDVEADRSVGRRNYPMLLGRPTSAIIYGIFLLLCYLSIVIGVLMGCLPWASLLGLLTLFIAVPTFIGARNYADDIEKLIPHLAKNVIITVTTPILVAIGLLVNK
jgi:1,4-dihydroxy-2-naphthoate octaprenyltransferase